jgi:hypothetical protein
MKNCWILIAHIAIWEAEVGRTEVRGQFKLIVLETPSPKQQTQNGLEAWLKWYSTCFTSMKP